MFAKAPRPGRVKTRLARDVGDQRAAAIYSRMGQQVLEGVLGGSYEIVVCFDPPDARSEVMRWLNTRPQGPGLSFRPQGTGDLGDRLAEALEWAFTGADETCVIGTDAPDVGRELVERAFAALAEHDVVMGPATDGGYYLVGARDLHPVLFQDIPWSTDRTLAVTLDRARAAGLGVHLLEPLSDIDVVDDLPSGFR